MQSHPKNRCMFGTVYVTDMIPDQNESILEDNVTNFWIMQHHDRVITRRRIPKTNFVEVRTFLHLFRSFDRMWAFFILAFQVYLLPFV